MHGAEKIHIHGPTPVIHIGVFNRPKTARVISAVYQYINAAKFSDGLLCQRQALFFTGNVCDNLQHFGAQAQLLNFLLSNIQFGGGTRSQNHSGSALFRRQGRHLLTETGTNSGYNNHFIFYQHLISL